MNFIQIVFCFFAICIVMIYAQTDKQQFEKLHQQCIIQINAEHTHRHTYSHRFRRTYWKFGARPTFWLTRRGVCYYKSHQRNQSVFHYCRGRRYDSCLIKCLAEKMKLYGANGFNVQNVLKELVSQKGLKDVTKLKVDRCISENKNENKCDEVYDTVKCYYTSQCNGEKKITKPTRTPGYKIYYSHKIWYQNSGVLSKLSHIRWYYHCRTYLHNTYRFYNNPHRDKC